MTRIVLFHLTVALSSIVSISRSELDRFSMKAELFREIHGHFLLNKRSNPHFLLNNFKQDSVTEGKVGKKSMIRF